MNNYKFRAKRVDNGEWVYGCYGTCLEFGDNGGVEHMYREMQYELCYIIHPSGFPSHLVNPDTLGQFTGLTDINENEIYENQDATIEIVGMTNIENVKGIIRYNIERACCVIELSEMWKGEQWNIGGAIIEIIEEEINE